MRQSVYVPKSFASGGRLRRRRRFPTLAVLTVTLAMGAALGLALLDEEPRISPVREHSLALAPKPPVAPRPVAMPEPGATPGQYDPLLDSGYSLGLMPRPLAESEPMAAGLQLAMPLQPAPAEQVLALAVPALPAEPDAAPTLPLPPLRGPEPSVAQNTPLPLPRPSDLRIPAAPEQTRTAERQGPRRTRAAAAAPAAQAQDNRSFFEKLFGVQRGPAGPALAYAAPEDNVVDESRGRRLSPLLPSVQPSTQYTAIYDISARTVYLPNGERLEAHSGLGDKMDDPRFAHVRMQGVTPPHTYNLVEREALFHGVRAIRLHPVGGSAAIHGRSGLLAHSYLLGPRGDSNGCVSFKDYDKFLQAYLRGEVKRLVVVARL